MAYPTTLDTITTTPAGSAPLSTGSHTTIHTEAKTLVESLQAKVGIDSSAVTSSLDYIVKSSSSSNPGHKHTQAAISDSTATPAASKIVIADGSGKIDGWVSDASTTVSGKAEASIASEVTTGTDSARYVTPDSLAGSNYGKRIVQLKIIDDSTTLSTGDGKLHFFISSELNGYNLVDADACVSTVSSSGTPTVAIYNVTDTIDMLSTNITIDVSEKTSYTAATAPVINATYDDVATGDEIRIDVDVAGTGVKGLTVILSFQLP